jgi:DNA invertase Pin-like site-specific DNA recombinase
MLKKVKGGIAIFIGMCNHSIMDYIKALKQAERRRNEIKRLHAKRWTAKEIAEKFGISTQRVYAIVGPFKEGLKKP